MIPKFPSRNRVQLQEGLVINRILSRVGGDVRGAQRDDNFLLRDTALWGGWDLPGRRSFGTRLCNKTAFLVGSFKLHKAQQETVQASFYLFVFMKTDNMQAQANTFQIDVNQALKVRNESPSNPSPSRHKHLSPALQKHTLPSNTYTCISLSVSTVEGSPFYR